jgi:hypothetical protein
LNVSVMTNGREAFQHSMLDRSAARMDRILPKRATTG